MEKCCSWAALLACFLNNMSYIKALLHIPEHLSREGGGLRLLRESEGNTISYPALRATTWIPAFAGKVFGATNHISIFNLQNLEACPC